MKGTNFKEFKQYKPRNGKIKNHDKAVQTSHHH